MTYLVTYLVNNPANYLMNHPMVSPGLQMAPLGTADKTSGGVVAPLPQHIDSRPPAAAVGTSTPNLVRNI